MLVILVSGWLFLKVVISLCMVFLFLLMMIMLVLVVRKVLMWCVILGLLSMMWGGLVGFLLNDEVCWVWMNEMILSILSLVMRLV